MPTPSDESVGGGQLDVYDVIALQEGRVPGCSSEPSRGAVATGDASRAAAGDPGRICAWCAGRIAPTSRRDAIYCGVVCRKRAWRFGRAVPTRARSPRDASRPPAVGPRGRFAYADPPYPGKADYYDERQEVDHFELIARLEAEYPDGWALSTSARPGLRDILPMCPASTRVCAWRRRVRSTHSRRALSAWEPLLVVGGRELQTERPQDVLDALDYRGRYDSFPGAMVGMKPPEFAVWMFAQLGAEPGDQLDDLFPGSGAIGRAWALYTSRGPEIPAGRLAA
jgi:hypothetical protein